MKRLATGYGYVVGGWMLLLVAGLSWIGLSACVGAAEPDKGKVVTRKIKTMDDACDLSRRSSSSKGSLGSKGSKPTYAEGSFSGASAREKSDELRRMHEQAFSDGLTNAASSNAVTEAQEATASKSKPKETAKKKK